MKYQVIAQNAQDYPIKLMCQTLEVSESGYYAWKRRPLSHRAQADQQIGKATVAAAQGAQIWFDNPNDSQCSNVMFHEPVSVGIGADHTYIGNESLSPCIKDVCEALIAEDGIELPLKGRLSYLLYKYHAHHRPDEPGETTGLLVQAARWFKHPHMSQDLIDHYLTTGDVLLAVQHHLAYYLWQFVTLKTYHPLPLILPLILVSHSHR